VAALSSAASPHLALLVSTLRAEGASAISWDDQVSQRTYLHEIFWTLEFLARVFFARWWVQHLSCNWELWSAAGARGFTGTPRVCRPAMFLQEGGMCWFSAGYSVAVPSLMRRFKNQEADVSPVLVPGKAEIRLGLRKLGFNCPADGCTLSATDTR